MLLLVPLTLVAVALDLSFLGPRSGGWLDLRGALIVPWIVLCVLFAFVSSALVAWQKPGLGAGCMLYAGTAIGLVLLAVGGVYGWILWEERAVEARMQEMQGEAMALASHCTLERWSMEGDEVQLQLLLTEAMDTVDIELDASSAMAHGHLEAGALGLGVHTLQFPVERYGEEEGTWKWSLGIELERDDRRANIDYSEDPYPGEGWLVTRRLPEPERP